MSALEELFAKTKAEGRAALIGYLPAGFPSVDGAIAALQAMVEGGVDAIEIGLPYSDPLLDGPTIQAAVDAALSGGVTTEDVMRTVAEVAKTGAPTLVMSYWNPIEKFGVERFAEQLAAAGGVGAITADIIPEEAGEWIAASTKHGLDRVFLVAPSSSDERIKATTDAASGFVYAAAVMGVTGARAQVGQAARDLVQRTKACTTDPVCVGLGVSTGGQAAEIAGFADGVIVGSAFVRLLLDAPSVDEGVTAVRHLAEELAAGVRASAQVLTGRALGVRRSERSPASRRRPRIRQRIPRLVVATRDFAGGPARPGWCAHSCGFVEDRRSAASSSSSTGLQTVAERRGRDGRIRTTAGRVGDRRCAYRGFRYAADGHLWWRTDGGVHLRGLLCLGTRAVDRLRLLRWRWRGTRGHGRILARNPA